jgi:hypothetical protein
VLIVLGLKHPFTRDLYEQDGHGNVRVTAADGRVGLFRPDGSRVGGDLVDVDPQLCGWIAGPKVAHHRIQRD